jgi:hypothetical protein
VLAAGLGGHGCHRAFACAEDEQCLLDGLAGACEAEGYCSFPDGSCASGRRFGEHASAMLAGTCVGEPGATSDGSTAGGTTLATDGFTSVSPDGGTSTSTSSDGPVIDTEFDPCEGLVESGPVKATADGQVIEGLRITAEFGPGIEVDGHSGVTIRNCEIHQIDGPGISFRAAPDIRIEDVVIVHDAAKAAGSHDDSNQTGIDGTDSAGVVVSRVRLERGSSGIDLETTLGAQLSFIEVHDVRGPGEAPCVRVSGSDEVVLEDFSCENPLDTSRPGNLIEVHHSSNVTVRRGLLDGHNAEFGYGVHFTQTNGKHSGGLVEDVDGVRQTNGAFSCYSVCNDITFRRTRARDNICEIVSIPIEGCSNPVPGGGCVPGSDGVTWTAAGGVNLVVIEDSVYFDLCADPVWPVAEFTIERGDLVEEDFEPRAPIRVTGCWE